MELINGCSRDGIRRRSRSKRRNNASCSGGGQCLAVEGGDPVERRVERVQGGRQRLAINGSRSTQKPPLRDY
ncbi:hypothetical protein MMAN_54950 [Mycobacterium mantenii]|uniref:Uncharacterized protein n=1 Tax=Mycobacterium mantenii TaxID=560555 RepID=A0ABM7K0I5_MYCNT|nr:hypothetical protein MMAN_54950 [Mycobacterium mantenii]